MQGVANHMQGVANRKEGGHLQFRLYNLQSIKVITSSNAISLINNRNPERHVIK